jgi:transposase
MVDHIADSSQPRGRVEIRTGVGSRRRWSDEEKGRIVAESYAPGVIVSEVARRHEMSPQHLFAWRKAARAGRLPLAVDADPMFVPIVSMPDMGMAVRPLTSAHWCARHWGRIRFPGQFLCFGANEPTDRVQRWDEQW